MKFTLEWLKDHISTKLSADEIAQKLTSAGLEVDDVIDNSLKFENFIIGKIVKIEKHSNADKLNVCDVDVGDKVLSIVCGASNVKVGIFVVVALVGAIVPCSGNVIKSGNIRGVPSQGMLCSASELLIDVYENSFDGIIELPNIFSCGMKASDALGCDDIVFNVSITPNRADCFSVRGIARELAAVGGGEFLPLTFDSPACSFENPVSVEIETENCLYFSTCAMKTSAFETPAYIAKRLQSIGQKLIFAPVDIANYVCFDIGQPLHVFDFDKLQSKQLVVRGARENEKIKAIDNKEHEIPQNAIVVGSEADGVCSVAGIVGGEHSGFSEKTVNILIESAYFDKVAISNAGQKLRMSTESRTRFERGVDPDCVDVALRYAVSIISKNSVCLVSDIKKYKQVPSNVHKIALSYCKFHDITGLQYEQFAQAQKTLEQLGCSILSVSEESMILETPSFRHDLLIAEDIVEEIVRIYGYDNIEEKELEKTEPIHNVYTVDKLSDIMVFQNYYEVKTFSFVDRKTANLFSSDEKLLEIVDPLTVDFSVLRPSAIASHLISLLSSQNKSQKNSRFFEIGKKFSQKDGVIVEENMLTATVSEKIRNRHWREPQKDISVFDIKEDIERIVALFFDQYRITSTAPAYFHPGRSGAYVVQKDTVAAYFGEIHPSILSALGVSGPVVCFELFLNVFPEVVKKKTKQPIVLSQYQPIVRDFSFVVAQEIRASQIVDAVNKLRIKEIKSISVFDVYESESIGIQKKALTFEVLLQSQTETLSEEKTTSISDKIIDSVFRECDGILRKMSC